MTEPTAPMSEEVAEKEARRLIHDVYQPTSFRDDTPAPAVGSTPPVPQPGRPPMSQGATDASVLMLSAGVASLPIGGMTALVIYTLGTADPVALAIGAAAPAALAVPIFALSRLVKRAKPEPDVHHHYNGNVIQQTTHSKNTGLWARTDHRR